MGSDSLNPRSRARVHGRGHELHVLAKNSDGSVDLYFGPEQPADAAKAKNSIKTVLGAVYLLSPARPDATLL